MIGELDLYGVFVPPMLLLIAAILPLSALVRLVLSWCGVYRYVWHRPLFDVAVFVILLRGAFSVVRSVGGQ